ncbi:RES family NAD+ phosphorylase [Azospirillum sp. A1-3]|uniref:RES family NAD+ phosphorylase n=1 Tax=Azospirillum sp. A1-3 TaxID=185874 RepID=UPI00207752CF|nr:RES family NAD+ phosphorylase [Azospirillum sp. A1-3]
MKLLAVAWTAATRIIASRFPPIDLFERLSGDPRDWEAFIALESLVNPRLRQEAGEISLVPPEERIAGPGASYVMSAFTHVNPNGSRFSDGRQGVYYAARAFETALRETVFHYEQYYADADQGLIRSETMRVLVGTINGEFHDVGSLDEADRGRVLDPDDYSAGQALASALREEGANGIHYPSVRHPGGACIGAFRPKAVGIPAQTKHLEYHWDGTRIDKVFDYQANTWSTL